MENPPIFENHHSILALMGADAPGVIDGEFSS